MPSAPSPVNWLAWFTSRVNVGVRNTVLDRWVTSELAMISLAKELFSSSVPKFMPAVRDR
ncbi:hypothetical protein D3C80_1050050 [compost metagenome]